MESILSFPFIICKTNSQGGPRHAFGGMISLIAVVYKFSQRVDAGFLRTSGQWSSPFTLFLWIRIILQEKEKKKTTQVSEWRSLGLARNQCFLSSSSLVMWYSCPIDVLIYIYTHIDMYTHMQTLMYAHALVYIRICAHVDIHMCKEFCGYFNAACMHFVMFQICLRFTCS